MVRPLLLAAALPLANVVSTQTIKNIRKLLLSPWKWQVCCVLLTVIPTYM